MEKLDTDIDLTEKDFEEVMEEGWGCSDYKDFDGTIAGLNKDLEKHGLVIEVGYNGDDNIWTRVVKLKGGK